jgi:hypothetical protein
MSTQEKDAGEVTYQLTRAEAERNLDAVGSDPLRLASADDHDPIAALADASYEDFVGGK